MEKTVDEVKRLQNCINDLISVLALPAIWSGNEACEIVGTLLDVLLGMLRLDFAYARVSDSSDGPPIELIRLTELQHRSTQPREVGRALDRWLSGDETSSRFVIPNPGGEGEVSIASFSLGLQGQVGTLVAGSRRADFPTEIERLLLRVAANQTGIGLQEARRSDEQKRIAEVLEERVGERTRRLTAVNEELRRSEVYLAEAQRLSHTGSFGWKPPTGDILWSEETFRIFHYDRSTKPTVDLALQRVHPEDARFVKQIVERASLDGKDFDYECRLLMPGGSIKHVRVVAHALRDESGQLEFVGAVMDTTERKRAEEALRRSEHYLAEAQRLSHTGSWAYNPTTGKTIYWSEEMFRIYGLDHQLDDAPSRNDFYRFLLVEDRHKVVEHIEKVAREKAEYAEDHRIMTLDGTVKQLHVIGHPVLDETEEVIEYVGTAMDVTERRRAEQALRERADLLDLTHDTIIVRDMQDVITYWNGGARELYGWTTEEAVGKTTHKLIQTIFPVPLAEINEELISAGRWEGELTHTKRDGMQVVVASRWSLQRDDRGRPAAILETNNDITDRKRAEAKLRDSEEQWRDVFENNPTMYFMVNAAGTVLSVNPFGAGQLGYTVNELVGQPVLNVFPEYEREAVQRNVANCLEQIGQAKSWEARKVRKDGAVIWVRETAKAVPRANGPIVLIACEDITEQRRAAEAVQRAEAELAHVSRVTTMGELTASLAHEINQPITAAVTNANTAVRWLAGDNPNIEEARAAAIRSAKDGTRASEIISRIRLLFKKGITERELVDVNAVIREMMVLLRGEATRYSVLIRTELANDLPQLRADRVQLQQVMLNLIMNSIDAMKDVEGTRELVVKSQQTENEQLLVSVSDTGVGLPTQQSGEIFNAFFTTKLHGIGLGLSISRSIVESHGGRLWADGNSTGGATFHVALPTTVEAI